MRSKLLLVSGIALASVALASQDSITLARTLTADTTEIYKVDSKVNQTVVSQLTGEMPLNVTSSMTYTIKTGKVDATAGKADVEVTETIDKMDADGPMGQMLGQQQIKPLVQKGTMDKRGHMILAAVNPTDMMQLAISGVSDSESTLFIEFPDHPVKVGDTWNIVVPKSPFTGPDDQNLTAKLTGDKNVDGHDVWVVSVSGLLKMAFDTSKLPATPNDASSPLSAMKVTMKGTVDLTGEGLVDKGTGKTLSLSENGKMKTEVEIPDHEITLDATGTVSSTVKLQG